MNSSEVKGDLRNVRVLARLFEFEEFEEDFENCPDTLRPFGWRRIDFPKGDHRRPPAFLSSAIWVQAFRLYRFQRLAVLKHFAAFWGALGCLDWAQTNAPTTALTMRLAKKIDVEQDVLP